MRARALGVWAAFARGARRAGGVFLRRAQAVKRHWPSFVKSLPPRSCASHTRCSSDPTGVSQPRPKAYRMAAAQLERRDWRSRRGVGMALRRLAENAQRLEEEESFDDREPSDPTRTGREGCRAVGGRGSVQIHQQAYSQLCGDVALFSSMSFFRPATPRCTHQFARHRRSPVLLAWQWCDSRLFDGERIIISDCGREKSAGCEASVLELKIELAL